MVLKHFIYLSTFCSLVFFYSACDRNCTALCSRTQGKTKNLQIAEIYDQNTRLSESNIALSTENTTLKQTIEETGITEYSQAKRKK